VNSLYHREGAYHYSKGVNPRAIVALATGIVIALVGLAVRPLHFLYDYAWFAGFFVSGAVYLLLMRVSEDGISQPGSLEAAGAKTDLR
jgi:NCS1 family nucleobase:cation symporter-1